MVAQDSVTISGTIEGGQDTCEFVSHKCSFKGNILSCALDDDPSAVLPLRFASNTALAIADQDAVPVNSMACGDHAWLSGNYTKVAAGAQQQSQPQDQQPSQDEQGASQSESGKALARLDAELDQCAEKESSEEGFYKCLGIYEKKADAILNQNYKAFAKLCDSSGDAKECRAQLKAMQPACTRRPSARRRCSIPRTPACKPRRMMGGRMASAFLSSSKSAHWLSGPTADPRSFDHRSLEHRPPIPALRALIPQDLPLGSAKIMLVSQQVIKVHFAAAMPA